MKLVKVAYGDDDDQKSFQQMQGLIQAYPNLKGVISPTTVGVAAAARYLSTSPEKGKVKLTGLGFPNQMRKFVEDGTVDEFQLWVPKDVGYLAGQAAAALVAGRITGKPGETFTAGRLGKYTIGAERRDRARAADDVQQGQHRQVRLLGSNEQPEERARPMTRTGTDNDRTGLDGRGGRAPIRARVGVFGIGLEAYWGQFDGLLERIQGYQRRVEERVAALGARRGVRRPRRHRGGRARGGGPLRAPARSTSSSATRSPTRRRARCCPPSRRRRRRSSCSGCSRRRRSTTRTPTPASGWPTARRAACRRSRARSRARASRTTRSPGRSTTTSAPGRRSPRGCAPPASRARCAGRGIGFLGHTYPGMLDMYSDFTAVHAQLGAHVEVLEIDDLGARVAAADGRGDRPQAGRDPRDVRLRRSVGRPDRRADRARPARLVGARRRRPRPARRRLRPRRAHLLLPRPRRQRGRAPRRGRHRRQLAAHRARDPDGGRGRPEDERRPADPRPPRRGRVVHRVLRARLRARTSS